eukprot:c14923_g1_i2.p1 GENE.c14923_g1_i2~~c14923_g1_i2.p1  ORF type:complete len:420 (+),score=106.14 c14923_g1_i2:186-1262(+)
MIRRNEDCTPAQMEKNIENLSQMVFFCENEIDCRRVLIMRHFGERFNSSDCKRHCDNCKNNVNVEFEERDMTDLARAILRVLEHAANQKPLTLNVVVEIVKGSKTKHMRDCGYDKFPEYGAGADLPKGDIDRVLKHLIFFRYAAEDTEITLHGSVVCYLRLGQPAPPSGPLVTLKFAKRKRVVPVDVTEASSTQDFSLSHNLQQLLFTELKEKVQEWGKEINMAGSHIFLERPLREIVYKLPENDAALAQIEGMGEKKREEYGPRITAIVLDFIRRHPQIRDISRRDSMKVRPNQSEYFLGSSDDDQPGQDDDVQKRKKKKPTKPRAPRNPKPKADAKKGEKGGTSGLSLDDFSYQKS